MTVTNFISEVWAGELLAAFNTTTKFASPVVVNHDYEGVISQSGDTVHITSINDPTITAYVKDVTTLTYEALTDASRALLIDQSYEFSFMIDDLDKRQAANGGNLMSEAARRGGAALAKNADTYVQSIIESDTAAGNITGATSITTSALAVARLVDHKQTLDENDVPEDGRWTIVPSWFHSLLVLDDRFMTYDALANGGRLLNGVVGRALGFNIIQANYALAAGDDWNVYSGHSSAITFADQINEVEGLRLESKFGDALRGLHLYGAKVTRPSALAYTLCSIT
jgi:hypothetical protein